MIALSATAAADVRTNFNVDGTNSSIEEFSVNVPFLVNNSVLQNDSFGAGGTAFDYSAQTFRPSEAGSYYVVNNEAPVDTAFLIYRGDFDPTRPEVGLIGFNDDYLNQNDGSDIFDGTDLESEIASCAAFSQLCPAVLVELDEGQTYTIVVSTFSPNAELEFPFRFFVFGPGGVFVGVEEVPEGLFEEPVAGRRDQPAGAYLDRIVAELSASDPDNPVVQALLELANLSDEERRAFVESMGSNISQNAQRAASVQTTRSTLATIGNRIAKAGLTSGSGNGTATFAGETVQLAMADMGQPSDGAVIADPASAGFTGDDFSGLANLASAMAFHSESAPGQTSTWTEGYGGFGTGSSYDYRIYGGLVGADYRISDSLLAGGFVGVGHGRVDGEDAADARVSTNTVSGGFYGAYAHEAITLDTSAVATFGRNTHRRTAAALTDERITGKNRTREIALSAGARYTHDMDENWAIEPNARVSHSWIRHSAYSERGDSAFTLDYDRQNQRVLRTSLGLDTSYTVRDEEGPSSWQVFGGVAWGMTNRSGGSTTVALRGAPGGDSFTVTPDNSTRHSADINTGLSFEQDLSGTRSFALRVTYDGSFASDENEHVARLALGYRW